MRLLTTFTVLAVGGSCLPLWQSFTNSPDAVQKLRLGELKTTIINDPQKIADEFGRTLQGTIAANEVGGVNEAVMTAARMSYSKTIGNLAEAITDNIPAHSREKVRTALEKIVDSNKGSEGDWYSFLNLIRLSLPCNTCKAFRNHNGFAGMGGS